jgi:rod shape-determining protein MreC
MARERGGDRREVAVLAACLVFSGLLFAFGETPTGRMLTRVELALLWPADAARGFVEGVVVERRENERLKRELLQLRQQYLQYLQAQGDSARAERVTELSRKHGGTLRPARVIGTAGEPWPLVYHLSVGKADGVMIGQPVISPEGLVGRIEVVDARTSSAALVTDPLLAVACVVHPGGARGVLRFRLGKRPGLYLQHVPLTDTVSVGSTVATSGMSQRFPAGIPVGRVARVARDPGGLVQEIEVHPSAPLTRLREVFVDLEPPRQPTWREEDE